MITRFVVNPARAAAPAPQAPPGEARDFHRRLPGYAPTPLVSLDGLGAELGLERLWVKDESLRLGMPSFKILGASWAVHRALLAWLDADAGEVADLATLRERLGTARPRLVAATDGNHGRAVARMAQLLGLPATVFCPDDMVEARRAAIRAEGAEVRIVDGTYDDAVALAAAEAGRDTLVIADVTLNGEDPAPRWVIEGYATILLEADEALRAHGEGRPDLVLAQIGVGAFAAAVGAHYRRPDGQPPPLLLGVEPEGSHCALAAAECGRPVPVPGPHTSIMAGLNCGQVSRAAQPTLAGTFDAFVAVDDAVAERGMRDLAGSGVVSGESGAVTTGALRALLEDAGHRSCLARLGAGRVPGRVLVISTEGATDPLAYRRITGTAPDAVRATSSRRHLTLETEVTER